MAFLHPSYLWALLGLLIPIAIHLWSKKEGKTVKIGSIKLLDEADSKQSNSIKFNELWLLLLRMALVSLLVFILAEPQIRSKIPNSPLTYIIEPSLINTPEINRVLDTVASGAPVLLLKTGFPEWSGDEEEANGSTLDYWQLASEMESLQTDSIVVFTNAYSKGFKGRRPEIRKKISWIPVNQGEPISDLIEVTQNEDRLQLRSVSSDYERLSFGKEEISTSNRNLSFNTARDSVKITTNDNERWYVVNDLETVNVLLLYEAEFTQEATYLEAAFNALSEHLGRTIEVDKTQDTTSLSSSEYQVVVGLGEQISLPESVKTLVYNPNPLASSLITPGGSPNEFYLTSRLNPENIIEEHLAERLIPLLDLHPGLEEKIKPYDKRVMEKAAFSPRYQDVKTDAAYSDIVYLTKWLWIALILLLVTERIFARLRKQ